MKSASMQIAAQFISGREMPVSLRKFCLASTLKVGQS
jgi:hypothetical protein